MPRSEFDYDPEKDGLSPLVTFWIIVAAVGAAIYLSLVLV
jgi:hypothetical protein